MKAAFGKIKITPQIDNKTPDFFFEPDGVLDDLHARIVIFNSCDNDDLAVVIGLDLIGLGVAETATLENKISEKIGIDRDRIWISTSHSHSAPILCPIDLFGGFTPYFSEITKKITDLISSLIPKLENVSAEFGRSICDFNVNRRKVDQNGNCVMMPNLEGIVDKRVPIIAFRREDRSIVGIVFSYCCHPTILLGPKISGDYPSQAALMIEAKFPDLIAIFLPGVFGNVRPNLIDENGRFRTGTDQDAIECGRKLANAVIKNLDHLAPFEIDQIRTKRIKVPLPLDHPPNDAELDQLASSAIRYIRESENYGSYQFASQIANRQWIQQVRRERAEDRLPTSVDYTFTKWQFGDLNWIGFSGEFFLEYGVYAEEIFGEKAIAFGYTQGCQTYVPTAQALIEGGYEPNAYKRWRHSAPFSVAVEDRVKSAIRDLI